MNKKVQTRLTDCWQISRALLAVGDLALGDHSTIGMNGVRTLDAVEAEDLHCLMKTLGLALQTAVHDVEEMLSP